MAPDSQSIASFEVLESVSSTEKAPQSDSRSMVSRMKKVYDDLHAHLYICMFLRFGAQNLSSSSLSPIYRKKTPRTIPNLASLPIFAMNEGE